MDLVKSYESFQPELLKGKRIHIIGCGSVGSTIAENLARFGITDMTLYDFDKVESRNVVNQMFTEGDVGRLKVEALQDILLRINPNINDKKGGGLRLEPEGWTGQKLSGYVFLAVDSIKTRREIVEQNKDNEYIDAMFDFRTGLTDGQHFAADWYKQNQIDSFYKSMDFTDESAKAANPVTACNVSLCVCTTIRVLVGLGVQNFIDFVRSGEINKVVLMDLNPINIQTFRG